MRVGSHQITLRPLFAGYLFRHPSPDTSLDIVTVPGATGFVGFGRGRYPIPGAETQAIERTLDSGRCLRPLSAEWWARQDSNL
ncbi:MAG TPA: hypothetical protein PLZ95_02045 [Bryobacteraceae bacterium]|nr:hypothetical protein [Bryobacteraceae bacterium]